jgi:hypothetical protein
MMPVLMEGDNMALDGVTVYLTGIGNERRLRSQQELSRGESM